MKHSLRIVDRSALRLYVAGVVVTWLEFVCHLTNHAGACWFSTSGPAKRLYWWAWNLCNPDDGVDPSCCNKLLTSSLACNLPRGHDGHHVHSGPGSSYAVIDLSKPAA